MQDFVIATPSIPRLRDRSNDQEFRPLCDVSFPKAPLPFFLLALPPLRPPHPPLWPPPAKAQSVR